MSLAIEFLYRLQDMRRGRRRITELDELDRYFQHVETCFKQSADAGLAALEKIRFVYKRPSGLNPGEPAYRSFQMDLYRRISGRSTYDSYENEKSNLDLVAAKHRPYPWATQSHQQVGDQLVAQGHLIRSLDLKPNSKILEFGAGWGNLALNLALMGHAVTAVEIDQSMCELIRHRAEAAAAPIKVVQSGMLEFSTTETYDAVIFYESFHHCDDPPQMLEKVKTLLARNGCAIFASEPITYFPYPWGLRMDGLSLWSIRKYGWLELGFDRRYWHRLLREKGFTWQRRRLSGVHIASLYRCRLTDT